MRRIIVISFLIYSKVDHNLICFVVGYTNKIEILTIHINRHLTKFLNNMHRRKLYHLYTYQECIWGIIKMIRVYN